MVPLIYFKIALIYDFLFSVTIKLHETASTLVTEPGVT